MLRWKRELHERWLEILPLEKFYCLPQKRLFWWMTYFFWNKKKQSAQKILWILWKEKDLRTVLQILSEYHWDTDTFCNNIFCETAAKLTKMKKKALLYYFVTKSNSRADTLGLQQTLITTIPLFWLQAFFMHCHFQREEVQQKMPVDWVYFLLERLIIYNKEL